MNNIIVDIICHCRVEKAFGVAQRTHGTTDPGGVLAPRPSEGMLNNPLSTYAENGQCNRPTTNCIVFGTACLCLCLHSYRLVLRVDRTPVQDWFIRVSETGCAINEGFFFTGIPVVHFRRKYF